METSSIHLGKEMEAEAGTSARRSMDMKAEMHRGEPSPRGDGKRKRRINSQAKGPEKIKIT